MQSQGEFRHDLNELDQLADTILERKPDPDLVRGWIADLEPRTA